MPVPHTCRVTATSLDARDRPLATTDGRAVATLPFCPPSAEDEETQIYGGADSRSRRAVCAQRMVELRGSDACAMPLSRHAASEKCHARYIHMRVMSPSP